MSQTHPQSAKGFSLLELMVVVGVFGVLVAASVPAISGSIRTARLEGAAATLAADLRYARSLASAQRKTYQVSFGANAYSLNLVSPPTVVRTRTLPRGVTFGSSSTATFYAWGLTQPATITVADHKSSNTVRLAANGSVSNE